jgi:hypothetical protein
MGAPANLLQHKRHIPPFSRRTYTNGQTKTKWWDSVVYSEMHYKALQEVLLEHVASIFRGPLLARPVTSKDQSKVRPNTGHEGLEGE